MYTYHSNAIEGNTLTLLVPVRYSLITNMRPNEKPWSHKLWGFSHFEELMIDTRAVMRSLPLVASVIGQQKIRSERREGRR
jgi:hypothetical protein